MTQASSSFPFSDSEALMPSVPDPTPAPSTTLPLDTLVRQAMLELLRHGLVDGAKPNLYQIVLSQADTIRAVLANLDLDVRIDDIRGLAYLVVADGGDDLDEWSHPLVRKQRLTLEQSLLVAILRQQFIAHEIESGVGALPPQLDIDDLLPHLQAYLGFLGSDQQERKRLLALLEQLKGHGLVSDIDEQERVTIRPIIVHLANPENLQALLQAMNDAADRAGESADNNAREEA
ncbi:TPA: DUF4194 domain-containing protein [Stenotrophomonas maltophilia]|nr:DUF4194 domain-containing protein [Stenotrophomonas maltophilia]